jgi:hypothetical protein
MELYAMPRNWLKIGVAVVSTVFSLATYGATFSTGPIPQYTSNVTSNDGIDKQSSTISTTDKPDQVESWFKANLPKGTRETTTSDGAHIFYLPSGATVDVERDGQGSNIGMTWQAR